jgi:hypothetical protein
MPFDARGKLAGGREEPRNVHPVRTVSVAGGHIGLVCADALGSPAEQRDGTTRVAPARVRQPDCYLGESLP